MLEFIKKIHTGAIRGKGTVPDWHHLERVSRVLEIILNETGEGTAEERATIVGAALGHDALEDTDVTPEELAAVFGARGLTLIKGMTNTLGDGHQSEYVAQVSNAEEAVRLIKLSDLYDNVTGVTYELFSLGTKWCDEYFLPIVVPMMDAVLPTDFKTFPKAADRLKQMVRISRTNLLAEIERFKAEGK